MNGRSVVADAVFAAPVGFRPLTLDLHLPDAPGAPVVLFVHGGGWRVGSRRAFLPGRDAAGVFGRIVSAGFAIASIDYRLSGEAVFPAQLDDVLAAVDWLVEHGGEHGLDPARIVAWGESAGAHLAALAALTRPGGLAGVVDWYGPADLTRLGADLFPADPGRFDRDPTTREAGLLGGPVAERAAAARAASPALLARAEAPPFLLLHGADDDLVPPAQSARFADALRAAGADVELGLVPSAGHFFRGVDDLAPLLDRSIAFARRVTALTPSAAGR